MYISAIFPLCGFEPPHPNHGEAVYIINSVRNCISPTQSVVYHHFEAKYTLARDDIPPEGRMIYTALCAVMIYHCFAMDKKSTSRNLSIFGLPDRIRTCDLQSRSLTRYPAVPRVDTIGIVAQIFEKVNHSKKIS